MTIDDGVTGDDGITETNSAFTEENFLVVALGASAGGLEALEDFFHNTATNSGMAYVIIQHLSPDFKSVMDQLLERQTEIPIHVIEHGMKIEANTIYLLPPRKEVIVSSGRLLLADRALSRELSFPIDEFFRSLAQDFNERSVAVVLSGTGSDGSRGILDVHAAGGLVIAQTEASSAFDGMPRSACDTGIVDIVLAPKAMPAALTRYKDKPSEIAPSIFESPEDSNDGADYMESSMRSILAILNQNYGLDFSQYRAPTIARRIERRLHMSGTEQLDEYEKRLKTDVKELDQLYRDLLIGVTGFFRDRGVFERLEFDVMPSLIEKIPENGEFRAWVAGTATGEEAYSLAILLIEKFEAADIDCKAKIFASDVHDQSLFFAGRGIYQAHHLEGVTPERLERFFTLRQDGYHVSPELRKMVVFTPHNFLRDAPFTRLDLVTCRNVLIYLTQPAQRKALSMFHFALKKNGILCLGASETVGDLKDEFETIFEVSRIYRKHRDAHVSISTRTGSPRALRRGVSNQVVNLLHDSKSTSTRAMPTTHSPATSNLISMYDKLLDNFIPPSILINENRELIHSFAGASKFLRVADGRPSSDMQDNLHPDLKSVFLSGIRHATKTKEPITFRSIECDFDKEVEHVKLTTYPIIEGENIEAILVQFESDSPPPKEIVDELYSGANNSEEMKALDRELQVTRNNLQSTIQELQTTNEEFQAGNEELTAANEELQSTNEELHSVNEELYTVNAEHQRKIDELTELTDDMDNLLTTTNVHTLFLDRELLLRRFTPKAAELFNLIPQDIARRFGSFTYNLVDDDLIDEIKGVLETGVSFQKEVQNKKDDWFLLRIFPYLAQGHVDGVVLTLVDITSLKKTAEELRLSEERFDLAVKGSNEGIWDWSDVNQESMWCSDRLYELIGLNREETQMTFSLWTELIHPEDRDEAMQCLSTHLEHNERYDLEYRLECGSGDYRWFHVCGEAVRDENNQAIRMAGSLEDISESRKDREDVQEAVRRRDEFLAMLSHELRNPLGAILNATSLLESGAVGEEITAEACNVVTRQSRQMARLLDDLLDVSRITHGKIELHLEQVNLLEIANEAIDIIRPKIQANDQQISVELPNHSVYVHGDPSRLQQVFANLLTNATKYTPQYGDIAVTITSENNEAVVRFQDTGCGMTEEMQGKVFELFVQSDATIDRSNGGMGVGLTLVRAVLDLHGGEISAKSAGPNKGSEFTVRLPQIESPSGVTNIPTTSKGRVNRVVIVEDIKDARMMFEAILQLKGCEVFSAKDGKEGYELISKVKPDLALIDIGLPEMDGYEVARKLRADETNDKTYLVALTGYAQKADREAVKAAGFNHHLVKPLKQEELDQILEIPEEFSISRAVSKSK